MCHCGQLLFLSSNDRPVQSLDLAASERFGENGICPDKSEKKKKLTPERIWIIFFGSQLRLLLAAQTIQT